MLVVADKLINLPVGSIQSGHRVGTVTGFLIDPNKLQIVALYVQSRLDSNQLILYTSDIKTFNPNGLVIDHNDRLMTTDNLVRLQEIIDIGFVLNGKPVVNESKRKLGKISSFAIDTDTFLVMRLNVHQSMVKNLSNTELIIHRQQIVTVTDSEIVVRDATVNKKASSNLGFRKLFISTNKPVRATPEPSSAKVNNIS